MSGQSRKTRAIIVEEINSVRELITPRDRKEDAERKRGDSIDRRRSKSEGSYQ